jgi:hypothetical protein
VKAAALLLRDCNPAARDIKHEASEYSVPFGFREGHQNSAAR